MEEYILYIWVIGSMLAWITCLPLRRYNAVFFSDFIRLFLKRLSEADEAMNTCTTCQNSYNETLAEFHPWYIRKAATLAMHALPNRPDLLKKVIIYKYCIAVARRPASQKSKMIKREHKFVIRTILYINPSYKLTLCVVVLRERGTSIHTYKLSR